MYRFYEKEKKNNENEKEEQRKVSIGRLSERWVRADEGWVRVRARRIPEVIASLSLSSL